jgi:hypothetical protein
VVDATECDDACAVAWLDEHCDYIEEWMRDQGIEAINALWDEAA